MHFSLIINYLTYANANLRWQLRARKLRNGQSGEGQCQAAAIVTKGFSVDVSQPRRYHICRNSEYQKGNWEQEPAGVNGDPRIRGWDGDVCNPLKTVST